MGEAILTLLEFEYDESMNEYTVYGKQVKKEEYEKALKEFEENWEEFEYTSFVMGNGKGWYPEAFTAAEVTSESIMGFFELYEERI